MAEYLSPGVYVEEVSSGMKPMEGVSTSTAGFIGMTRRGPLTGVPEFVGSFMEFQRKFGGYLSKELYGERGYLPISVEQFFANGGSRCFVVRLLDDKDASAAKVSAGGVQFTAANVGAWGNQVKIACKKNPMNDALCTLVISCPEYEESYADVSLAQGSDGALARSLERSLLVRASVAPETDCATGLFDLLLPLKAAADLLTAAKTAADDAVNAAASEKITAAAATPVKQAAAAIQTAVGGLPGAVERLTETASVQQATEEQIKQAAEEADQAVKAAETAAADANKLEQPEESDADAQKALTEAYQAMAQAAAAAQEAASALKKLSGKLSAQPSALISPAVLVEGWAVLTLSGGADCAEGAKPCDAIDAAVLKGQDAGPGKRTGLCAFLDIPEISIVAAPGVTDPSEVQAVLNHCETMNNRVCILDMPFGMNQVTELQKIRAQVDSSFAAMYHPWIQVFDPIEKRPVYIPPSGAVAGIYARTDNTRGVHKAPANEVVRNCTGLETLFGKAEQDMLNPVGVNLIRSIPGQGIRVWGARTCSSDSSWKYINVRRLFIFLEESIRRNTGWAVFEPNDQTLWTKVYNSITSFLGTQWRDGALAGASESEAFFVNVGLGSSMTQDDVLNGRMVCVIGVAPSRPAEFIIFRISQIMEANS